MGAAPSYCRAGRSASGAAGLGTARALQLGVSVRRPGRARGVRRANFYAEETRARRPRCDLETARRVGVLVLEDDEGGGACASGPAPRGAAGPAPDRPGGQPAPRLRARPAGRASLGANESAAATGARPPRFLFSFSTPRAAGAALHRRGFPGTLPPHAPLGPPRARPLLNSLRNERLQPQPGPARAVLPRRLASPRRRIPPRSRRLALKPGRRGAGGRARCLRGCGGSARGEWRKTRRGAPAGLRGDPARTRGRAPAPRGPRAAAEPLPPPGLPESQSLMASATGSWLPGRVRGRPAGMHQQGYLGPAPPCLRVWVLGVLEPSFLRV